MNMKFREIRTCGFLRYASRQTDRQTNMHTDSLITILRPPTGGEVTRTAVLKASKSNTLPKWS